jgi:hypothetical protein
LIEISSLKKLKEIIRSKSKINKITGMGTYKSQSVDGTGNGARNRDKNPCELGSSVR